MHIRPHFVGRRADGRANPGDERCAAAHGFRQALQNAAGQPPPAGMRGADAFPVAVGQDDRHAIGGFNDQPQVRLLRPSRIRLWSTRAGLLSGADAAAAMHLLEPLQATRRADRGITQEGAACRGGAAANIECSMAGSGAGGGQRLHLVGRRPSGAHPASPEGLRVQEWDSRSSRSAEISSAMS